MYMSWYPSEELVQRGWTDIFEGLQHFLHAIYHLIPVQNTLPLVVSCRTSPEGGLPLYRGDTTSTGWCADGLQMGVLRVVQTTSRMC